MSLICCNSLHSANKNQVKYWWRFPTPPKINPIQRLFCRMVHFWIRRNALLKKIVLFLNSRECKEHNKKPCLRYYSFLINLYQIMGLTEQIWCWLIWKSQYIFQTFHYINKTQNQTLMNQRKFMKMCHLNPEATDKSLPGLSLEFQ